MLKKKLKIDPDADFEPKIVKTAKIGDKSAEKVNLLKKDVT
jgi:hypothetical protein